MLFTFDYIKGDIKEVNGFLVGFDSGKALLIPRPSSPISIAEDKHQQPACLGAVVSAKCHIKDI